MPQEVTAARVWNQKDILSNLWGLSVRLANTVPAAKAKPEWATTAPPGWSAYLTQCDQLATGYDLRRGADRSKLALEVGGGVTPEQRLAEVVATTPSRSAGSSPATSVAESAANQIQRLKQATATTEHDLGASVASEGREKKTAGVGQADQAFQGAELRVFLYERDLVLASGLWHAAATTSTASTVNIAARRRGGGGMRNVVGVVGLAHVPGIVANWGHQVDCSAQPGGLLHPRCSLPWRGRWKLAVMILSGTVTMGCANWLLYQQYGPHAMRERARYTTPAASSSTNTAIQE